MISYVKKLFSFVNSSKFTSVEEKILKIFAGAPKLPGNVVDFIVFFGPYLVLIGGILGILSVFTLLAIPVMPLVSMQFIYLNVVSAVITGIAAVASFDELQKKSLFGWRLIFWTGNLSIILSIIASGILGAIIAAVISWYILSQIRAKYN